MLSIPAGLQPGPVAQIPLSPVSRHHPAPRQHESFLRCSLHFLHHPGPCPAPYKLRAGEEALTKEAARVPAPISGVRGPGGRESKPCTRARGRHGTIYQGHWPGLWTRSDRGSGEEHAEKQPHQQEPIQTRNHPTGHFLALQGFTGLSFCCHFLKSLSPAADTVL